MFKSVLAATVLAAAVLAATTIMAGSAFAADAQQPKRTVLERIDVPGSAYTTIVALTEIAPDALVERHVHPGTEMTYVIDGGGDMFIGGEPVMHVRAGDHWEVAAGTPHYLKNGSRPTKLLVTYVLKKGKPLAVAVPEKTNVH